MTRIFLKHPVSTWMIFTAFVIMGLYALPKLKIEAIPEVDLPSLSIVTSWNGASPQAIQRSITLPIEEAVRQVHGVESVSSTSRPGRSTVEVAFRRGTNLDFARLDLGEQVGALQRDLPLNAQAPQIFPYVPEEFQTENFFTAHIESPLSPNELRDRAENRILPRILAVDGVADARIMGGARPLVKILLKKDRLDLYGLNAAEVIQAVLDLGVVEAAGVVREEGYTKTLSLREHLDMEVLAETVVARRGRQVYRLGQLAELHEDFEDPFYLVRANGRNVVQLAVDKRSGANTVAVSRALRQALPEIAAEVGFDVQFHVNDDQGDELESKLWELIYRSFIILGLLFLLMAVSLRQVKLTAIVTGSIFFTILISLSLFYFLRISVNFITISGLTVSFGLILDNSILVLDSIHRRVEHLKRNGWGDLSRRAKLTVVTEAIRAGTGEVAFPILATTLTTLVAFLSFILLSGRLSLYYVPLAVAVATALLASLFVAFGWLPVVLKQLWAAPMVRRLRSGKREIDSTGETAAYVEELPDLASRPTLFDSILIWCQRLWWVILPPVVILILWSFVDIYPNKMVKGGFWRLPDRERLFLYLEMPAGTILDVTSEILERFETRLVPVPDGARMQAMVFGNQATISVEFSDSLLRTEIPMRYRHELVEEADATGGSSIVIQGFSDTPYIKGSFSGSALNSTIKISGYNSRTLNQIAENTKRKLSRNRRVRKARITSGQRFDRMLQDETVITLDRSALAERGLTVMDLVQQLRLLLSVDTPWSLLIDGEQERVQFAYAGAEVMEYADLMGQLVPLPNGGKIRIADLIQVETRPTAGSVIREDQRYTVHLNWEYIGTDKMRKATIRNTLNAMDLPYGYHAEEATQEFITEDESKQLTRMAIWAGVFIFIVLAALFESVLLPFLVLFSLPMALCGVFLVFWLATSTFDSSARIGLVLLFGIVVNNAILLVSRYRHEVVQTLKVKLGGDPGGEAALFPGLSRQLGGLALWRLPRREAADLLRRAIARGTRVRLRSILLTSGTTIVGLAPLLFHYKPDRWYWPFTFASGSEQDIWENLALSSIGGLASSTVLLLLSMPALYYFCVRVGWLLKDLGWFLRRKLRPSTVSAPLSPGTPDPASEA